MLSRFTYSVLGEAVSTAIYGTGVCMYTRAVFRGRGEAMEFPLMKPLT